ELSESRIASSVYSNSRPAGTVPALNPTCKLNIHRLSGSIRYNTRFEQTSGVACDAPPPEIAARRPWPDNLRDLHRGSVSRVHFTRVMIPDGRLIRSGCQN